MNPIIVIASKALPYRQLVTNGEIQVLGDCIESSSTSREIASIKTDTASNTVIIPFSPICLNCSRMNWAVELDAISQHLWSPNTQFVVPRHVAVCPQFSSPDNNHRSFLSNRFNNHGVKYGEIPAIITLSDTPEMILLSHRLRLRQESRDQVRGQNVFGSSLNLERE